MFDLLLEISNVSTVYTIYMSILLGIILVYTLKWDPNFTRVNSRISLRDEFDLYVISKLTINTKVINWVVTWINHIIKKYIYSDLDIEDSFFLLTHS
ncbi:hypothetical protein IM538_22250 [Cytobacillus suaedae]|nr:hypothetical protein IM538_22250 [Cytobacillus suaedae]